MEKTLMETLLDELDRVKNLIAVYKDPLLKGAGNLTAALMEYDRQQTKVAIANGDTVQMLVMLNKLKSWEE